MRVETGRLRVVAAEAVGTLEPAHDSKVGRHAPGDATTPGSYIRTQRIRQGISLDQLAATTNIPRGQLELLEDDQFEALPAMVFAKGFLRCCARALELDPDTVLGLLYERERERLRARRRESSAVIPSAVVKPSPAGRGVPSASAQLWARASVWLGDWAGRIPSARILMWLVVAIAVAVIVLIAFTLASGQASQAVPGGL